MKNNPYSWKFCKSCGKKSKRGWKYKGLIYLIRAMPDILKKFDVLLLIAGDFWQDNEKNEIKKLKLKNNF